MSFSGADKINEIIEGVSNDLAGQGWSVLPGFFAPEMMAALFDDVSAHANGSQLKQAGIGRESANRQEAAIRNDQTLWLDGGNDAQAAYLLLMEEVRRGLNQSLFLGLFDYECHYALYQPGGFYKKHVDSLHGARNRVVSCVTYLTPDWQAADEGWLVLYDAADENRECARILPKSGTLALFLSEQIPHEVLPPRRARASIAGWFRCNGSQSGRVDPGR